MVKKIAIVVSPRSIKYIEIYHKPKQLASLYKTLMTEEEYRLFMAAPKMLKAIEQVIDFIGDDFEKVPGKIFDALFNAEASAKL